MLRRLSVAASIVVLAGFAFVASAVGGPSESFSISWAFVGEGATPPEADVVLACPAVPDGLWVLATGTLTFSSPTGSAGNLNSAARGTAVDSAGNTYRWNYHQSIQPIGDGSQSTVVDEFVLAGSGPAGGIRSHFIATIAGTDLETTTEFELRLLKGDPFNCDPL